MFQMMRQMLCEANGQISTARVMCLIALVVAIVITFTQRDFQMATMWAGFAFGGKVASKVFEEKSSD